MELIEEGFSGSTVMDVSELRSLYYGRADLYISFTDDGDKEYLPQNSREKRPAGYICYALNDVVARKVKTSEFYANVFRIKKGAKSLRFIEDLRQYDARRLQDDVNKLNRLDYFSHEEVAEVYDKVSGMSTLRSMFHRLWTITRLLAETKGRYYAQYWRRILIDIGYSGFQDPQGLGILERAKRPVVLQLDIDVEEFDIVPIQKRRKDPRRRVRTQVNRQVRRMATKRNRVAKKKFMDRREERGTNFMDTVNKFLGGM